MKTQIRLVPVILLGLVALGATAAAQAQGPPACVQPPNTTMVAWYSFDTVAGTPTLTPNLATANSGQVFGPTLVPGKVGKALSFNGSNNYVESPSSIVTNFGPAACPNSGGYSSCPGDFSIDTWIQVSPAVASSQTVIVDKRSGSQPAIHGYSFFLNPGNGGLELGLQLADGFGTGGASNFLSPAVTTPPLTDGQWHHIAVTVRRGSATGIRWYHNGVQFGTPGNPTSHQGSLANASPLRIGTRTAAPPLTGWFKGSLDELEIFNRVLTPAEVHGIFMAGPSGKCK